MVKIYADGADKASILELNNNPLIEGFTTNPTLLKKSGITDYTGFALDLLKDVKKSISFEVISDDFDVMYDQAIKISNWGENVYVKIPITNTKGGFSGKIIHDLLVQDVKLNITAITTMRQIYRLLPYMDEFCDSYISIFAGRIADCGIDPLPIIKESVKCIKNSAVKLIWASPREVYNIYQAESIGCDIITCTPELIKKYETLKGKDLTEYSLDTVKMFYNDAIQSGLTL